MPLAALRPCPSPRCPVLTRGDPCANHARAQARAREAVRAPLRERGWYHTTRWQKARLRFLLEHPICQTCNRKPANTVDHIIPHHMNEDLFWDAEHNWRSQCQSCHSRKTATQDGGFGNPQTRVGLWAGLSTLFGLLGGPRSWWLLS